jgi:tetratricopeptide (TPR) repeat protein
VWAGYYARADLLIVSTVSVLLSLFLFAALMLYRYAALLDHDFAERFMKKLGLRGVRALTLLVLALPLILTIGFAWLIPYWLALTFIHQTRREKALSVVSLFCFVLSGPLLEFHSQWSRTIINPAFRAALSSDAGTFEATDVFELQSALDRYPDDRDLKFLLAVLYKDLGEYELSASMYREMLNDDVTDLAGQTNLGNIYFAQRDWEGAILQYSNAIADHPDFALTYYNKSLAHGESFRFSEREAARAQAENLDAPAIAAFEQRTRGFRAVADVRLAPDYIFAKFFGLEDGVHPSPPRSVRSTVLSSVRVTGFAVGAILFAVLTLFLEVVFRDRRNTQRCGKCGGPFCTHCQIGTGRRGLCTQCYHLFIVKDGVSTDARNQKLGQVNRYAEHHRLVFRILSVVAPGAGHVAEGAPLFGFPLLLLWILGAVLLVFQLGGGGLYPNVDLALGLGSSLITYLVGAVMLLLLVVANTAAQPRIRA